MKKVLKFILIIALMITIQGCSLLDGKVKRVGNDARGYADIPVTWLQLTDNDEEGLRYASPNGAANIALHSIPNSKRDAEVVVSEMITEMTELGAEDIKFSTVEVTGKKMFKLDMYIPNEQVKMVMWAFDTEDDRVNFSIVVGEIKDANKLVELVEGSLSDKDE